MDFAGHIREKSRFCFEDNTMIMRKYAGALLMVCLIAGSAFASNSWTASTGSWGTPPGGVDADWSNGMVPAATEQVKIKDGTTCTVDVNTCVMGTQKLSVGTSDIEAVLNIVSGGTLNAGAEVQVGGDSGIVGRVTQTGGTVNLVNGTASAKIEVGYKTGVGNYTISGGSIVGDANYSQLLVGASGATGGTGTFTVVGTGGSISISKLYVGASTSYAQYTGTGTLAFEINGGVSAINAGSVNIDPTGVVEAVANLSVTKTGALPTGDIILINNTGINGVRGAFDNVAWGGTVTLGGVNYTLTNTYIGGLDGIANDVALIPALIPDTFTLTYTAGANGSIIGTTPQTVNYGTDGTAVTAQPALGYHFVKWSDDSTQNPRTDLNVTANITVQASFAIDAIDTFTLTYTAGANGSIIGTTPQTVNSGADGTAVTAQPALGYHFVKWSDDSTQNPRTDVNVTANITVQAGFAIDIDIIVITSKCKVAAGKTQASSDTDYSNMTDAFTASGTISGFPSDPNTIRHIDVNIVSADGNSVFFEANDFNYARNVKNGKFTHTYKISKGNPTGGAITSLVIDFSKKTFAVTVSSADLTGLACPLQLIISLGDFVLAADVNEAIVNGPKTTIPTRLMRMYKDTLIVPAGKAKVKSDSLSVTGEIAVADINATEPNLYGILVVITWGSKDDANNVQTFTIPIHSFKIPKTGHLYTVKGNIAPVEQPNAKVGGTIDLDKCTFKLSITKADLITVFSEAEFGIAFADFNETANVTLP